MRKLFSRLNLVLYSIFYNCDKIISLCYCRNRPRRDAIQDSLQVRGREPGDILRRGSDNQDYQSQLRTILHRDLQQAREHRHERQLHVPGQQPGHEEKVSIFFLPPQTSGGANICLGIIILSNLQTRIMFCAESPR